MLHAFKRLWIALFFLLCLVPFAMAEEAFSLPIDFSPGMEPSAEGYIGEWEYADPSIQVKIEKGRKDECDYWVARIKIAHPSQLRTAAAAGFDEEFTVKATHLANRQNAVLALDGDYFFYTGYGYILRQGQLFLNELRGDHDVLAVDEDGDFHIFPVPTAGTVGGTVNGKQIINAMHFGPALVVDGETGDFKGLGEWLAPEIKRQRMCIAQTGPLEYLAVCCAGPARGSYGMDIYQFANLAQELGAKTAYNLDGGDSTIMIFKGEKINDPQNKSTRDISDIIYFASAWDGKEGTEE